MMEQLPLILSLDTSTKCCSISLTRGMLVDGEVLASLSLSSNITHSRRLVNGVDQLFRETDIEWCDIAAVAVGLGPGSFTGLRIGLATAKGFASAADIKLVGVSTLDGLAANCLTEKKICSVLDARKKQVYSAFYQRNSFGQIERTGEIRAVSPEILAAEIDEQVLMVGDGITSYGKLWKSLLEDNVEFAPCQLNQPSASAIGLLCGQLLKEEKYLDIGSASPLYVRASDAELSLADKKKRNRGLSK